MLVVPWLLAVLTQAPAAGPVEVAGRVVDAKRQPVAGAEVWVSGSCDRQVRGGTPRHARPLTRRAGSG